MGVKRKKGKYKLYYKGDPVSGWITREQAMATLFWDKLRDFKMQTIQSLLSFPNHQRDEDVKDGVALVFDKERMTESSKKMDELFKNNNPKNFEEALDKMFLDLMKELKIKPKEVLKKEL